MKWESIKKDSDLNISEAQIERVDGAIRSLTLFDDAGDPVQISYENYSQLKIYIPAKPKLVSKYAVRAAIIGIEVDELFDSSYEANKRAKEINDTFSGKVSVVEVQVPEAE